MKLKNDFYTIRETQNTDKGANFVVHLNADHFIYAAHFPGNPITPGVCLAQIVKELTEELVQVPLFLKVVKNIKFMQIINPLLHDEVTFALSVQQESEGGYKVSANIESGSETFSKMSLQFLKQDDQ